MIGILTMLVANWKLVAGVVGTAAVFALLAAGAAYEHNAGYQQATDEWTVKYQKREAELQQQTVDELAAQDAANAAAKAQEEADLEAYRLKLDAANKLAMQLADEASADKNANNIALDADAIARHKRRIGK